MRTVVDRLAGDGDHTVAASHKGDRRCTAKNMQERGLATTVLRQEAEANRFAAGILMPKPWFTAHMNKLGDVDVEHIRTLARRYETSLEATIARYIELTDDCCAFVFSKDGVVRYARPTRDFPRLAIKSKEPLPDGSLSVKLADFPERVASQWMEIDGTVWLERGEHRQHPPVLEQTMLQRDGYQLTLLLIQPDDAEDADENEDLEEKWTVQFRR